MDAEEALDSMPCSAWPLRCCRDRADCMLWCSAPDEAGCSAPEDAGCSAKEDDDAVIMGALDEPACQLTM